VTQPAYSYEPPIDPASLRVEPSSRIFFNAGAVLERGIAILFKNPLPYLACYGVIALPMVAFFALSVVATIGVRDPEEISTAMVIAWTTMPLVWVAWQVGTSAMVHATLEHVAGRPIRIGESLRVGLRRFFPVLGVGIVVGLAAGLASIALLVPGLILMVMWSLWQAVAVQERRGVLGALGRAAELSKGHRWSLFGVGAGYVAISFAAMLAIGLFAMLLGLAVAPLGETGQVIGTVLSIPLSVGVYFVSISLQPILVAVAYHDLGGDAGSRPEELANVFG